MTWRALGWRPPTDRPPRPGDYSVTWSYEEIITDAMAPGGRRRVARGRTDRFETFEEAEGFRIRRQAHTGWLPAGASEVMVSEVKGPQTPRTPPGEAPMSREHLGELAAHGRGVGRAVPEEGPTRRTPLAGMGPFEIHAWWIAHPEAVEALEAARPPRAPATPLEPAVGAQGTLPDPNEAF